MVACALLIYMVFVIGDMALTERGYRFAITFYSVNGLTVGSSVSMAGVKIGKVESIEINDDQVFVYAYVREIRHRIRRRSTFTIGTAGLMGKNFVEIIPTRTRIPLHLRQGGGGRHRSTRMEELFEQGNELLKKLQGLAVSAKDIVGDPELKASTKAIFKNAESASERVKDIIESVQKKTDSMVANLDDILKKARDEIEINRANIRGMITNLKDFSQRLNDVTDENRNT